MEGGAFSLFFSSSFTEFDSLKSPRPRIFAIWAQLELTDA